MFSCKPDFIKTDAGKTNEDRWSLMQKYMADGAAASDERPYDGVMPEQEVLLKAAGILRF